MECSLPEFYDWSEPVARKEHRCCECDAPIAKGEKYFTATGKWDGEVRVCKQHLLCSQACMFIRDKLQGGECIGFGTLWDEYHEMRWQFDKTQPLWHELRDMLAKIKRREKTK